MIKFDTYGSYLRTIHIATVASDKSSWTNFQELVQRGANLWPDAPPEIKEFADLVTIGHVQQNYREQNKDQQRKAAPPVNVTDEQIRNKPFVE